ncbi:unnamed protein product, partial [Polarella glacialis]
VLALCIEAASMSEEDSAIGRLSRVSRLDDAEDFAEALFGVYGGAVATALPEDLVSVILDTPGHRLYWLALEQLAHHIVIEACDGVFRGYQSFKKLGPKGSPDGDDNEGSRPGAFNSFAGILVEGSEKRSSGYEASEWLSSSCSSADPSAHELWGGGRDLGREELAQ